MNKNTKAIVLALATVILLSASGAGAYYFGYQNGHKLGKEDQLKQMSTSQDAGTEQDSNNSTSLDNEKEVVRLESFSLTLPSKWTDYKKNSGVSSQNVAKSLSRATITVPENDPETGINSLYDSATFEVVQYNDDLVNVGSSEFYTYNGTSFTKQTKVPLSQLKDRTIVFDRFGDGVNSLSGWDKYFIKNKDQVLVLTLNYSVEKMSDVDTFLESIPANTTVNKDALGMFMNIKFE